MSENRRHRQQGLTIVELMVAMAIGLLIGLVVFASYLSGVGTQRAQTDMTRLQESARFGFELLARAIRRAGFRDSTAQTAPEFCSVDPGTAGAQFSATNDAAEVDLGGGVKPAVFNGSDVITVRYYGQDDPAEAPGTPDGVVLDCLGNPVSRDGGKADGSPVQDTIYVASDPVTGEPTLYCNTDNPPAVAAGTANLPLIRGVESLQILYAEDTDPGPDPVPNRYVPINKVTSVDDVRGMLISLVLRTPNATGADRTEKTFKHFGDDYNAGANDDAKGGEFVGLDDGRVRVQFGNYIAMRNFPACSR